MAASDGECNPISVDWETSNVGLVSTVSHILGSELVLLLEWKCVVSVETLPRAIGVNKHSSVEDNS